MWGKIQSWKTTAGDEPEQEEKEQQDQQEGKQGEEGEAAPPQAAEANFKPPVLCRGPSAVDFKWANWACTCKPAGARHSPSTSNSRAALCVQQKSSGSRRSVSPQCSGYRRTSAVHSTLFDDL